jgi:hypothetical protein
MTGAYVNSGLDATLRWLERFKSFNAVSRALANQLTNAHLVSYLCQKAR